MLIHGHQHRNQNRPNLRTSLRRRPRSQVLCENPIHPDLFLEFTFHSSLYDSIVYVKVGRQNINFGIHKGLLCHHSTFFDKALNGGFKEAVNGEVVLDDEDLEVFTRFNGWLYTGIILVGDETEETMTFKSLIDLYIFAEKRGVLRLKNAVVDSIIKKNQASRGRRALPDHSLQRAWTKTPDSSPLHSLLVDLYVRRANFPEILASDKNCKQFDKNILFAFILAFHKMKEDGSFNTQYNFWKRRCQYHSHNDLVPPCKISSDPMVSIQTKDDLQPRKASWERTS